MVSGSIKTVLIQLSSKRVPVLVRADDLGQLLTESIIWVSQSLNITHAGRPSVLSFTLYTFPV